MIGCGDSDPQLQTLDLSVVGIVMYRGIEMIRIDKTKKPPTVCVAMSGGVDSSVAALLLVQQGYTVIGAFMKNWSLQQEGVAGPAWEGEARDAEVVCQQLGIPFHIFDFEEAYFNRVVKAFVEEYAHGRTPNPDVLCNKEVKFDLFLHKARELGASKIATGHYARVQKHNNEYQLLTGKDTDKDQSYFLYTLSQTELPHILFPIGHLHKAEVRDLAKQHGLINAAKKDSQGICFIGPVTMRRFLQHYLKPKPGRVVTATGEILGDHEGVMFYTEGQRHGFDTKGSHVPLYVAQKRINTNELVVAPINHPLLLADQIILEDMHWVGRTPSLPFSCSLRVRYRQPLESGTVYYDGVEYKVVTDRQIRAVSIGQSIVLYAGERIIGGAVISGA